MIGRLIYPGRQIKKLPTLFEEGMLIVKKNPIVKVNFSYVGKASDFEAFLKILVRDYLAADDPATVPEKEFVEKVESDCV